MNIFEKQKVKKALRGCDYELAANVIHERFTKNIESYGHLGQLVNAYVANPCLETAIRLIEQDSMMFHYFNECKEDGLYTKQSNNAVRKPEREPKPHVPNHTLVRMHSKKPAFPNVISTLTYDCEEIRDQIKEFQRLIIQGKDVENNSRLLEHYKEGLREFEKAIAVLQKADGVEQEKTTMRNQPEAR